MARVTVEDCLKVVPNRFELTLLAAKRARGLAMGIVDPLVQWENDKPTVVALREIATGVTNFEESNDEPEFSFSLEKEVEDDMVELVADVESAEQQAEQLEEGFLSECSIDGSFEDSTKDSMDTDAADEDSKEQ